MKDYLPVVTLVIGAFLGLITSIVASSIQHRRSVVLKLLDQFLDVRKELVNAICPLTNIDLAVDFPDDKRLAFRDSVAELFYKHYDFLPFQVLDSLVRLQTCLDDPEHGPYAQVNKAIIPMPDEDIPAFIEECSLLTNSKLFAPLALKSSNSTMRHNQVIKLHSRHVLYTLNRFASIDELLLMVQSLQKRVSSQ